MTATDLTPEEIQNCLKVLESIHVYDEDHPDYVLVRRATVKRDAVNDADRAVIAKTATAAPDRIDDETRGNKLKPSTTGDTAGTLQRSRPCYICKQHYTLVDAFYHQLCPECAQFNHSKRDAHTDLRGKRAGAHTTITTRFPKDAARRFAAMEDSGEWLHRLRIVGIDLRDPTQVVALADSLIEAGPLDIIINNAAQTVRRTGNAYKPLVDAELEEEITQVRLLLK